MSALNYYEKWQKHKNGTNNFLCSAAFGIDTSENPTPVSESATKWAPKKTRAHAINSLIVSTFLISQIVCWLLLLLTMMININYTFYPIHFRKMETIER